MATHICTKIDLPHLQPLFNTDRRNPPTLRAAACCLLTLAALTTAACTQLPNTQRDRAAALHAPGYEPKQGSGIPTAIAPNLQQNSPLRLTDASSAVLPSRSDP